MTAAALLHPDVSPRVVERFQGCGIEIVARDRLEGAAGCRAALIFGGDGTVHRHLPQLFACKIPALVVPVGSGNDFAKALGIFSVDQALLAVEAILRRREQRARDRPGRDQALRGGQQRGRE